MEVCVTGARWVRAEPSAWGWAVVSTEAGAARGAAPALESLAIQMVKNMAARTTSPAMLQRGVSAMVRMP
jgi:hypothetical protein